MTTSSRKTVLIAGLGRFAAADPQALEKFGPQLKNKQIVEENIKQAKEAGYDCQSFDVDPEHPAETLCKLKDLLEGDRFDLLIIGYGIRGIQDRTALFEDIVNTAVKVSPTTKFGFPVAPDAVFETDD